MAAELKYNDEWLIPLRDGYVPGMVWAGGYMDSYALSKAESMLQDGAILVSASYQLDGPEMMAWFDTLFSASRGDEWLCMLDTSGEFLQHSCRIAESPTFSDYNGHDIVLNVRWSCYPGALQTTVVLATEDLFMLTTEEGNPMQVEGVY